MSEYYTFLDIIIGLKPEYLEFKKRLEGLKKYLEIYVKNVDLNFYVVTDGFISPRIVYSVLYNGKTSMLKSDNGAVGLLPDLVYECIKKAGNIYIIPYVHALVVDDVKFSSQVDKILGSKFVKNINFNKRFDKFELYIDSNRICFGNSNESFIYFIDNDDYSILSSQQDLLSYKIARTELPDYYVSVIEKNKCLKKIK